MATHPSTKPPKTIRERIKGINRLFACTVLLPTTLAILYYGFVASDVYVSESRFVVRSARQQQQTSMVSALLEGTGFSKAQDDTYPVIDYIESRDALRELNQNDYILNAYSKQGDFISRFHTMLGGSFENLWRYYGKHIASATLDPTSSITTLQVRSYTAKDAKQINATLIEISERLINRLNNRAAGDTVQFAQRQSELAAQKAKDAATALAAYRQSHTVFDPEKQSALQLQQVTSLQTQLFAAQSQLGQLQAISPQNPQIPVLHKYIDTLNSQIRSATGTVVGDQNSLSQKVTTYTRLELDAEFADKQLAAAMAAVDSARAEAQKQQLYLEVLVNPNTPDIAVEPKRIRGIIAVFAVGVICWAVLTLLIASIREHQD